MERLWSGNDPATALIVSDYSVRSLPDPKVYPTLLKKYIVDKVGIVGHVLFPAGILHTPDIIGNGSRRTGAVIRSTGICELYGIRLAARMSIHPVKSHPAVGYRDCLRGSQSSIITI